MIGRKTGSRDGLGSKVIATMTRERNVHRADHHAHGLRIEYCYGQVNLVDVRSGNHTPRGHNADGSSSNHGTTCREQDLDCCSVVWLF